MNTRKRTLDYSEEPESAELTELQPNKWGRKFLLGSELDSKVQTFVNNICISGGVINTAIVKASARGIG